VDCGKFTCSAMVEIHTMPNTLRKHRVLPLYEARDFRKENPFSGTSPLKEASCPQHAGEQLKVYDSTCRKAVCSLCALLPEHRGKTLKLKHSPLLLFFPPLSSPLLTSLLFFQTTNSMDWRARLRRRRDSSRRCRRALSRGR
jgi:hypothetical protein